MENKLSIENNVVEDVIRDSFDILGEEVEFGVEEFINEIIDKEDYEDTKTSKIFKKAYEIYRAGFLSAYLLRK